MTVTAYRKRFVLVFFLSEGLPLANQLKNIFFIVVFFKG